MEGRRRYRKRGERVVAAVQVNLDTKGLAYRKWGAEQRCQPGDWIVDNEGDVYTVNREVFARTYRRVSPGTYIKITPVWAEVAVRAGSVPTKEGTSSYEAGDYLVFNNEDGTDGYCIDAAKFEAMYELDERRE